MKFSLRVPRAARLRVPALCLALALLAACAPLEQLGLGGGAADTPAATLPPAPETAPQSLLVGGDLAGGAAQAALTAYGAALGVDCRFRPGDPDADLALLAAAPTAEDGYLDLTTLPLLAAAAARAGLDTGAPLYALPLGRSLYAYWADSTLLTALLGENCLTDVQTATWKEWQAFAAALTAWIAQPSAAKVTLNGQSYLLPAQKPEPTQALAGVFALPAQPDAQWAGNGAACTAPLLAAGEAPTSQTLAGPLDGLCSAFLLELANAAPANGQDIPAQLENGTALLGRMALGDLAAACTPEFAQRLVWLPFKGDYSEADLTSEEYNLIGLMDYPALAGAGYLAIPADVSPERAEAAAAAILWLYGSAQGESALIDKLLLITPWDTAADTTAQGAAQVQQVEAGILPAVALAPAQAAALADAWQALAGLENPGKATAKQRSAFVEAAAAALLPAPPGA